MRLLNITLLRNTATVVNTAQKYRKAALTKNENPNHPGFEPDTLNFLPNALLTHLSAHDAIARVEEHIHNNLSPANEAALSCCAAR